MSLSSEPPSPQVSLGKKSRALGLGLSLVDPRAWLQLFRMVHYYNYSHVRPRRLADIGPGVRMAPNVSLRNGARIKIGAYSHIGGHCSIWAGDSVGRITLGRHALLGLPLVSREYLGGYVDHDAAHARREAVIVDAAAHFAALA